MVFSAHGGLQNNPKEKTILFQTIILQLIALFSSAPCTHRKELKLSRPPKAVVLLSGGLDSATTLAITKSQGFDCYAMSFRYGQRHEVELTCAQKVAQSLGVKQHHVTDIDLRAFGGSALTSDAEVPKERSDEDMNQGIPPTYVPARNTIFLSFALAWAEVLEASDLFIGVNALDHTGYPDCRPEYIKAFERMANLATKAGVEGTAKFEIHTPLIQFTKSQIIQKGSELGVDFSITNTCYDPSSAGVACGKCDACKLRLQGFAGAGMKDPAPYQA